jgi:hypothetical protein
MRHFVKIRHRFKIPISLPVVTFRSPLGILPFLSAVRAKREKKMKYDPSASLVQTVFSFISRPSVESKEKKMRYNPSAGLGERYKVPKRDISGEAFFSWLRLMQAWI